MTWIRCFLILSAFTPSEVTFLFDTYAPYYSKGVMERVAEKRDLSIVDCMVSTANNDPIGTWYFIQSLTTTYSADCRKTDTSHPDHIAQHIANNRRVEFGNANVVDFCGKPTPAPEECYVRVYRYTTTVVKILLKPIEKEVPLPKIDKTAYFYHALNWLKEERYKPHCIFSIG